MGVATTAALVGALGAGALGARASSRAANTQAQAAERAQREALALQRGQYEQDRADTAPWREAGQVGLAELLRGIQSGDLTRPWDRPDFSFTMDDFRADPGYQFRMQEGMKAIQRVQGARGSVVGGGQAQGLMQFNQGLASDEFGRARDRAADDYTMAFNRFNTERQNRMSPLLSLAGLGQNATSQQLQSSQNYGNNAAQTTIQGILGAANARAAGTMGVANSLGGMFSQAGQIPLNQAFLRQLLGGGGGMTDDNGNRPRPR